MIELEVVHAGTEAATRRVMADLLGTVGVRPTKSDFTTGPFVDEVNELDCKGLRPKECSLAGKSPSGEFPRAAFFAKSNLARGPWPRDGLRALLDGMERRQRDRTLTPIDFSPAHTTGKLIIEPADGAVNSIPRTPRPTSIATACSTSSTRRAGATVLQSTSPRRTSNGRTTSTSAPSPIDRASPTRTTSTRSSRTGSTPTTARTSTGSVA